VYYVSVSAGDLSLKPLDGSKIPFAFKLKVYEANVACLEFIPKRSMAWVKDCDIHARSRPLVREIGGATLWSGYSRQSADRPVNGAAVGMRSHALNYRYTMVHRRPD
jgi:hypothetical protein